jgi:hypothetical protein
LLIDLPAAIIKKLDMIRSIAAEVVNSLMAIEGVEIIFKIN